MKEWCARRDSNPRHRLRRPVLYPVELRTLIGIEKKQWAILANFSCNKQIIKITAKNCSAKLIAHIK